MSEIKVLVADDDPAVRDTLKYVIGREQWLSLAEEARDADEAVAMAREVRPDVVLLDVKMPGGGGARAAQEIKACSPDTKVVVLSAYDDEATLCAMVAEGVEGYLVKGASIADILAAVRGVLGGETPLSPTAARGAVHELAERLRVERLEADSFEKRAGRISRILELGEVYALYQPIVELGTGRVAGLEAMPRFKSIPTVRPEVIFVEAERLGLAERLQAAALEVALEALEFIPDERFLSINLSPSILGSGRLLERFADSTPYRIVVEIAETALVRDYPALREAIGVLRDLGVRIAVDDVGAGHSALRNILELAPEFIKLDAALVRDVDTDRTQRALAASLAAFARDIHAGLATEGIDRPGQMDVVREIGFAYGQGDMFGRPMPLPKASPGQRVAAGPGP